MLWMYQLSLLYKGNMYIHIVHVLLCKEIKSAESLPRTERRLELEIREKEGYSFCFHAPVFFVCPPPILTLFPASVVLPLLDLAGTICCSSRSLFYPDGVLDSIHQCSGPQCGSGGSRDRLGRAAGCLEAKEHLLVEERWGMLAGGVIDGVSAWNGEEGVGSRAQVSQHKVGWVF